MSLSYLDNMYKGQTMRGRYEVRPGIWSHGYTISHMTKVVEAELTGILWFTPWCTRGGRQFGSLAVLPVPMKSRLFRVTATAETRGGNSASDNFMLLCDHATPKAHSWGVQPTEYAKLVPQDKHAGPLEAEQGGSGSQAHNLGKQGLRTPEARIAPGVHFSFGGKRQARNLTTIQ